MKKKVVALLALVMMLGVIAGCTSSKPAESDGQAAAVDTKILYEADESMLHTYTVIAVNPEAPFTDADGNAISDVAVNTAGADALVHWLLTQEALDLAGEYGMADYGEHLFYVKEDAPVYDGEVAAATEDTKTIRLSTTTSVKDSGLLDNLLPVFEQKYGYTVEVQSAGTGKAIAAAKYGNADVILVHAKAQEEAFVEEGFARVVDGLDSVAVGLDMYGNGFRISVFRRIQLGGHQLVHLLVNILLNLLVRQCLGFLGFQHGP